jgi:hypothetical protein
MKTERACQLCSSASDCSLHTHIVGTAGTVIQRLIDAWHVLLAAPNAREIQIHGCVRGVISIEHVVRRLCMPCNRWASIRELLLQRTQVQIQCYVFYPSRSSTNDLRIVHALMLRIRGNCETRYAGGTIVGRHRCSSGRIDEINRLYEGSPTRGTMVTQ